MRKNKKTERKSQFERCWRILNYIQKNSDKEHRLNQSDLRKVAGLSDYMGDKGTFNDTVNVIADTLNYNETGIKEEAEWRLVFDAFERENGDAYLEDDTELPWQIENEKGILPRRPVKNIYYKPVFSYEEINAIEEGILFSKTIGAETAKKLIDKIEENLTSVYYKEAKSICTVYEADLTGRELLKNNLLLIAEAINKHIQINMIPCSYNSRNELEPSMADKQYLSPYYLAAYSGRYYLLCARETPGKKNAPHQMDILRADLMINVELPEYERNNSKKKGIPVTPREKVDNLPSMWNDEFLISHLNMACGQLLWITLRISTVHIDKKTGKQKKLAYTFLHDWFGNTWRRLGTDPEDGDYDLVQVRCPAFAMESWALQYSDRVEVLEPEKVRDGVKRKVEALGKKYFVTVQNQAN